MKEGFLFCFDLYLLFCFFNLFLFNFFFLLVRSFFLFSLLVVCCRVWDVFSSIFNASKFQFNQQPKKIFIFNSNVHCFDKYTRLIRECVYEIYIHLAERRTYNDYLVFGFFKWFALIYTAVCYDEDQVEINKLYGCIQYVLLCIILHI